MAAHASRVQPEVSLGHGAGGTQKCLCQGLDNVCPSLLGTSEAEGRSRVVQAVHFSSNGSLGRRRALPEGGTEPPSPRRWDNSGHLCSEAMQTALKRPKPELCEPERVHQRGSAPTGPAGGLAQWPPREAWLQTSASGRLLLFDKVSAIAPSGTPYHVTTFSTTSCQTR